MNKNAQVGLFAILGIVAVLAVAFVLSNRTTRPHYQIGVHFQSASGLQRGAQVQLSGVPIGFVEDIQLLKEHNYTTSVIMSIDSNYEIPEGSRFIIQAPITGEPTVLIDTRNVSGNAATLPHEVLAIDQQPRGTNPTTFSDLLEQGQGEVKRLDDILSELQRSERPLLAELQSTLKNANELTTNANHSITEVTSEAQSLTDSLQKNLTVASNNVVDLTGNLNSVVKRNSSGIDNLLAELTRTSHAFGETVDSLRDVATNPKVKNNLINTTRDFALTAQTFAQLTADLRKVTGDQQTQAQLRDTVAQLDATSQKVNALVGSLGGTSSVYGVDAGATPAPAATPTPPGYLPTSAPAAPPGSNASPGASPGSSGSSNSSGAPPAATAQNASHVNNVVGTLRQRLNNFTKDLVRLQVRVGQLSPLRPGSYDRNVSPLLTEDRGLQSDFNALILPNARTGLKVGVNDVGTTFGTTTANFILLNRPSRSFSYGGGIVYSRLGLTSAISGKTLGFEARAYDLRHPTLDTYLNIFAAPKIQLFGGERDLTHASRRTVFGLQFEF